MKNQKIYNDLKTFFKALKIEGIANIKKNFTIPDDHKEELRELIKPFLDIIGVADDKSILELAAKIKDCIEKKDEACLHGLFEEAIIHRDKEKMLKAELSKLLGVTIN